MTNQLLPDKENAAHAKPEASGSIISLFYNLNIGRKLTVGFGILVALTLLSVMVSYLGGSQATAKIIQTDEIFAPTALIALRAQANLLRMESNVRGYLALGDPEFRQGYNRDKNAFVSDLNDLARLSPDPRIGQLKAAYDKWSSLPDRLFALHDDQFEREPAYRLLLTDGTRHAGQVLIDLRNMMKTQANREPTAQNMAMLQDMAEFQGNFAAMLSALRGYVTTRNRIFRGEYEVNLIDNQNAWDKLNQERDRLTRSQQTLLDNIEQNRMEFLRLPQQMFDILESDQWRTDLYTFRQEAQPLTNQIQDLLNAIVVNQETQMTTELASGRYALSRAGQLTLAGGIIALIVGLGLAYVFRSIIAGPIRRLTQVAERIGGGDLEAQARIQSRDETGVLAATFNKMTGQLRQTLTQLRSEKKRADDLLNVVIPLGVALAEERDNFNQLLENITLEAKAFVHAEIGILYLRTPDHHLRFVIVRNDKTGVALGGTTGNEVDLPPIPLYNAETGEPNQLNVVSQVALNGNTLNVTQAEVAVVEPAALAGLAPEGMHSSLTIPLKNGQAEVLGVLQLGDPIDIATGERVSFDLNLQQMMESYSSLAAAALEGYIREQRLRQEIRKLRIEIDEVKRKEQVEEIVESDFFQNLRSKVQTIRQRKRGSSADELLAGSET